MSELNHVLESITIIDGEGNISFKNYSPNLLAELNNRIIFKNPQRRDSLHRLCCTNRQKVELF